MTSPVERMNAYKGTNMPTPIIPLSGLLLGTLLPYVFASRVLPKDWDNLSPLDSLIVTFQFFSLVSVIFFSEFALGAAARATSNKASFSPAGAQTAGVNPFAVVQANRIHQNHIENFLIFAPIALANVAAGVSARYVVASLLTWVFSRIVYRIGYCNENPFWRICGITASILQWIISMSLFIYTKVVADSS